VPVPEGSIHRHFIIFFSTILTLSRQLIIPCSNVEEDQTPKKEQSENSTKPAPTSREDKNKKSQKKPSSFKQKFFNKNKVSPEFPNNNQSTNNQQTFNHNQLVDINF